MPPRAFTRSKAELQGWHRRWSPPSRTKRPRNRQSPRDAWEVSLENPAVVGAVDPSNMTSSLVDSLGVPLLWIYPVSSLDTV